MTTTVLVVGGREQLGLPVVRRLLEDGFGLRVLVRTPWPDRPAGAEEVLGEVDDTDSLRRAICGCDGYTSACVAVS